MQYNNVVLNGVTYKIEAKKLSSAVSFNLSWTTGNAYCKNICQCAALPTTPHKYNIGCWNLNFQLNLLNIICKVPHGLYKVVSIYIYLKFTFLLLLSSFLCSLQLFKFCFYQNLNKVNQPIGRSFVQLLPKTATSD